MRLPNCDKAVIPKTKIIEYLLSFQHRDGRSKAKFFTKFGFSNENWKELSNALHQHSLDHEITKVEVSPFGTRYVIEGRINTPIGRKPNIRSIWFIFTGEKIPFFVTAYPIKEKK